MTKKTLLLMRHARAGWTQGKGAPRDFDRPLSDSGRRDAKNMGLWLMQEGLQPDRVLCSPALRARQTAEVVLAAFERGEAGVEHEGRLYEAGVQDLLEVISSHAGHARTLMVVGHNPGFDALLTFLCPDPPRTASGKLMTTGAVAIVRVRNWTLEADRGELTALMRPKRFARSQS